MATAAKITVSLRPDLLHATDQAAEEESKARSNIISEALTLYLKHRERQAMVKGYREMAEFNRELAEASMGAVNEVWAQYG